MNAWSLEEEFLISGHCHLVKLNLVCRQLRQKHDRIHNTCANVKEHMYTCDIVQSTMNIVSIEYTVYIMYMNNPMFHHTIKKKQKKKKIYIYIHNIPGTYLSPTCWAEKNPFQVHRAYRILSDEVWHLHWRWWAMDAGYIATQVLYTYVIYNIWMFPKIVVPPNHPF